jgi:hypothetical protein
VAEEHGPAASRANKIFAAGLIGTECVMGLPGIIHEWDAVYPLVSLTGLRSDRFHPGTI